MSWHVMGIPFGMEVDGVVVANEVVAFMMWGGEAEALHRGHGGLLGGEGSRSI